VAIVKGFAGAYYKNKEGVAKSVICHKDKKGKQKRKELITSPVKVELKRL
jgi:hypothetical protein